MRWVDDGLAGRGRVEMGGVEQVINIFALFVEHFFGYLAKNALLCRK